MRRDRTGETLSGPPSTELLRTMARRVPRVPSWPRAMRHAAHGPGACGPTLGQAAGVVRKTCEE